MHRPLRCALPLLLLAGLLSGCAAPSTVAGFDERMSTYVGRSELDLVSGLGVPSRVYDDPSGPRFLQYDFASPAPGPSVVPMLGFGFGSFGSGVGVGTGLGLGFGAYGAPGWLDCSVTFELRDGRVLGFSRRGEGCTAPAPA